MDHNERSTDDHKHVMMLTNKEKYDVDCAVCLQRCSNLTFNCIYCPLHAHKQCIPKPDSFKSPYHPHVLTLEHCRTLQNCYACSTKLDNWYYGCEKCWAGFHIECAFLVKLDIDENQIQHAAHFHPLSRRSEDGDDIEAPNCKACGKSCLGKVYYGCNLCKVFLHKSCVELPEKITISFERNAIILSLVITPEQFMCYVCGDERHGFSYRREKGSLPLVMDVECVLSIHQSQVQSSNFEDVYFTFHRHPLIFQDKIENGIEHICRACNEKICSDPSYGCSCCNYFLHTSCIEPKQITCPYHPHPLKLVYHWPDKVKCKLCLQNCNGAFYACANDCNFTLDIECGSMKSIIKFHGHPHPLAFVEKVYGKAHCYQCFTLAKLSVFRCLQCDQDYNLDLKCGPIPCSIKSRHVHALDLCDSYVEDDTGEDSCDVCENRRDPGQAVYLCRICEEKDCAYLAEIKCVMPKVLSALRGDLGVVELRTVGTRVPGKVIMIPESGEQQEATNDEVSTKVVDDIHLFGQLANHLTSDEKNKLRYDLWKDVKEPSRGTKYEKLWDVIQYSDEAFKVLLHSLDCFSSQTGWIANPTLMLVHMFNKDLKLVKVAGDYMILQAYVPIHRDFVDKYGDVTKDCEFSLAGKSLLFAVLLAVILRMRNKQVSHITEDDLRECNFYLKYLHLAGFRIQFAFKNLNKLVRAYFGLQLVKFGCYYLQDLDQQIAWHSKVIEEKETKLLVVRTKLKEHLKRMRAKKSRLMDKCWSEGRTLKYKVGWELLL